MKNIRNLVVVLCVLAWQSSFAQTAHLSISDEYPAVGEKLGITYDPSGTPFEGKQLKSVVYFLDGKDYPVYDIDFKHDGSAMKGEVTVPPGAKAFFFRIAADRDIDDNGGKGYVYMIYKDKQPVEGAYAAKAYIIFSGMGSQLARIKRDIPQAIELYKKEAATYPENHKDDAAFNSALISSANPQDESLLAEHLEKLEKNGDETSLIQAMNILNREKKTTQADSIQAIIRSKYPTGDMVKSQAVRTIYAEKDLAKKDSLYADYMKRYPLTKDEKPNVNDNLKVALAAAHLQKDDIPGYEKYSAGVENNASLPMYLNNTAYQWAEKGEHLDEAAKLSRQSLDMVQQNIDHPAPHPYSSIKQNVDNAKATYDMYADTYAVILFKKGEFAEALKYQQAVYDRGEKMDPETVQHYAEIAAANKKYTASKTAIELLMKAGKSYKGMDEDLKKDYIALKGSDKGYDDYLTSLNSASKDKQIAELAAQMINKPAPDFTLKDVDGKVVSLKDLKGKTVIVDFWATWCGPCKASFPGMQMAVDKYKNDPNVKFLFVDTWERTENYLPDVKKFIADNKYSFHVLLDDKDANGKQGKVVTQYDVDGIPTKFIIDKAGHIRFKYVGYSGTPEQLVNEVTNMINIANAPDAQKVSMNN